MHKLIPAAMAPSRSVSSLHGEYVFTYYSGAATRIRIRVFRLVYLVYDMHAYLFKGTVFTKRAASEWNTRFCVFAPRIPHVGLGLCACVLVCCLNTNCL